MNDFEKVGKQMPYNESESYVSSFIEQCTLKALSENDSRKKSFVRMAVRGCMATLLILSIGLSFYSKMENTASLRIAVPAENTVSLDEALNSMSDEQLENLGSHCSDFPDYDF